MSTLDQLQRRDQPQRDAMMFEQMAESFIRTWAPSDPRENAEFCAQLFSILRRLAIDVQEPLAKQIGEVMARSITPMFMPPKSSEQG